MSLLDIDLLSLKTLLDMSFAVPKTEVQPLEDCVSVFQDRDSDRDSECSDCEHQDDAPRRKVARKPKSCHTKPWCTHTERLQHGQYHNLLEKLRSEDRQAFVNFCRITPELFDEICDRIQDRIEKQSTNFVAAHPAGLKLAITLRFLATGECSKSLSYSFLVPRSTISTFLPEVCAAIHEEYKDEVIQFPETQEGWRAVAQRFETKWNVPHALGAIDGKHFRIKKPRKSGSLYYNYKKFYSVLLLAVVDADYKFMYADIGGLGHQSDCQLYNNSSLAYGIEHGHLNLPPSEPLPNQTKPFPFFFLGDDAFALR